MLQLSIKELSSYFRTRLPSRIYFPLALFLYTASVTAGRSPDGASFARGLPLVYTLVLQFRLWDDLSCLAKDQLNHPDRVLSKTRALFPFHALLAFAFALNCVLISLESNALSKLVTYFGLNGALLLWYRWRRVIRGSHIAESHLVLLKYPLFIYLLADPAHADLTSLLVSGSVVYLCFCIYEVLHDSSLEPHSTAHRVLGLDLGALFAVQVLVADEFVSRGFIPAVTQTVLTAAATVVFTWLFLHHRSIKSCGPWNYIVFVIGFLQLLSFSFGHRSELVFEALSETARTYTANCEGKHHEPSRLTLLFPE